MTAENSTSVAKQAAPHSEAEMSEFAQALNALSPELRAVVFARLEAHSPGASKVTFQGVVSSTGKIEIKSNQKTQKFNGPLLSDAFGTNSENLRIRIVNQLLNAGAGGQEKADMADALTAGIAFVQGLAPRDEIELTLAAQMFAVHNLTMTVARRAATAEGYEVAKLWLDQTNKLSRTFTAQIEALTKMRGGGQQTVSVTHTHIDARGSQNVIENNVSTTAPGGRVENGSGSQSHTKALTHGLSTPCPEVRSKDEEGLPLPGTGSQRQKALSNARRDQSRSAFGPQKRAISSRPIRSHAQN